MYLSMLVRSAAETRCDVHAYVLMTNHVHLLLTPRSDKSVSQCMQHLGVRYARAINRKHLRTGTLWEERFHVSVVDTDDYVLACHRYVELNPVRAGLVDRPECYPWSSHATNTGLDSSEWLVPHVSMLALGRTRREAAANYRETFSTPMDDATLAALRSGALRPPIPRTSHGPGVNSRP